MKPLGSTSNQYGWPNGFHLNNLPIFFPIVQTHVSALQWSNMRTKSKRITVRFVRFKTVYLNWINARSNLFERRVLKDVTDSVDIADNIGAILAPYISQIRYHVKLIVKLSEMSGKRFSVKFITRFIAIFKHKESINWFSGGWSPIGSTRHYGRQ
jgi:hypothetical protein